MRARSYVCRIVMDGWDPGDCRHNPIILHLRVFPRTNFGMFVVDVCQFEADSRPTTMHYPSSFTVSLVIMPTRSIIDY